MMFSPPNSLTSRCLDIFLFELVASVHIFLNYIVIAETSSFFLWVKSVAVFCFQKYTYYSTPSLDSQQSSK